jgi:Ca-activated chloride channel family protein
MRYFKKSTITAASALVLGSGLFLAQDFQLRTKVNLVVVPTTVRDGNGSLVPGLTQEDFEILEDGKPQTISNFSTDPQPLSAAIVVDTDMSGAELHRMLFVMETLTHAFKENDEAATYRFDHLVTKLSDFTSDSLALNNSFESVASIAESKPQDSETGTAVGPSSFRWIINRTQIGTNGAPPVASAPSTAPASANSPRPAPPSRVLHDAIFQAATDLERRKNSNRKILVLISDGVASGTNAHSQGETVSRLFQDGVQVYAVSPEPKILEHMTLLNSYAKATGGSVFEGASEQGMATSFGKLVDQARYQYMLGYVSSNEVSGKRPVVRKLDVKVHEKKLQVIHRQNYVQYP